MRLLDGDALSGLDKAASRHVQGSKTLEQKWQRCRAQLLDGIASPVRRADDRPLVLQYDVEDAQADSQRAPSELVRPFQA